MGSPDAANPLPSEIWQISTRELKKRLRAALKAKNGEELRIYEKECFE
ncbi:MAG: hypothetical protein Q7R81_06200 [Candidatus Peregrinibacteria bacterium]|nr:hypothetical protein [Candidatus Peregrinibacteria bacterium]